jgi:hypothetical protein
MTCPLFGVKDRINPWNISIVNRDELRSTYHIRSARGFQVRLQAGGRLEQKHKWTPSDAAIIFVAEGTLDIYTRRSAFLEAISNMQQQGGSHMIRLAKALLPVFITAFILMAGCSDEKSPVVSPDTEEKGPLPPENVIGVMNAVYPVPSILLLWTQGSAEPDYGYNVYRKKGAGEYEKLNDSPVKYIQFIEVPIMIVLGYIDETLDDRSHELHRYYITAVSTSDEESAASDTVSIIPGDTYMQGPVQSLYPNGHSNVDIVPEFRWTPVAGATSYLLHMAGWLYRHESETPEILMGDELGVSYFNKLPANLDCGKNYLWSLWAVDENNCAIATANARFTTSVRTLVDQAEEAGYHCVWWDQLDDQGKPVPIGFYTALIRIDQQFMMVSFIISNSIPLVNAVCDPPAGVPPSISLSSPVEEWPPAEPVLFVFGAPEAAHVHVEIMRDVP